VLIAGADQLEGPILGDVSKSSRISSWKRLSRLIAASRSSSRRATWSFCTRSMVRVKRIFQPFSIKAKPIAEARWLFQPPGSPNNSSFVPFSSQASLAAMALI
jgi:hypothetical protein